MELCVNSFIMSIHLFDIIGYAWKTHSIDFWTS